MAGKVILEFYPIDFDYTVENNQAVIRIYGVTKDGKRVVLLDNTFKPYFYVVFDKDTNLDRAAKLILKKEVLTGDRAVRVLAVEPVKRDLAGKEIVALKVTTEQPQDIAVLREELKAMDGYLDRMEFDIPFVKRYLVDRRITPLSFFRATGENLHDHGFKADFVLHADSIVEIERDQLAKPNILAFDIEVYNPIGTPRTASDPIIMISFASTTGKKKLITWKRFENPPEHVEFVGSELDLIDRFIEHIEQENPAFVVGYNTDGFDFPYILARAARYKKRLAMGIDGSNLRLTKRGRDNVVKIKGRVHIDLYQFIKHILAPNLDTEVFDLGSVAEELIGEKKLAGVRGEDIHKLWDRGGEDLDTLARYCMKDSLICLKLADRIYPEISELTKLVGQPVFDVSRMTYGQCVEWFLVKNTAGLGQFVPNKPVGASVSSRLARTYTGAYVHEPVPGLYENIAVFDFRSLYPSIIVSHNVCPTTVNCECCPGKDTWFCSKKKGFIPEVLDDLIKRRARVKEILKQTDKKDIAYSMLSARSYCLKTVANAMYGYLGFARSRWYSLECASAITSWGRHYIHSVIESAKNSGFGVVYGDTDSIMVALGTDDVGVSRGFAAKVNEMLPGVMELEFQGFYPRGIFVSKKSDVEKGAKKKYALVDDKGNIVVRGFEYVRRDWSEIARSTQMNVIRAVIVEGSKEKALELVRDAIKRLKAHEVDFDDVSIYTQLTRRLESYESIGPHVAAAMKASKRGQRFEPGQMIRYVIARGEGSISERAYLLEEVQERGIEYDPEYYTNNQVLPAVEKIFEVLGYKKDELLGKLQTTLAGFFG